MVQYRANGHWDNITIFPDEHLSTPYFDHFFFPICAFPTHVYLVPALRPPPFLGDIMLLLPLPHPFRKGESGEDARTCPQHVTRVGKRIRRHSEGRDNTVHTLLRGACKKIERNNLGVSQSNDRDAPSRLCLMALICMPIVYGVMQRVR